jgi:hypothetical protein
MSGGTERLREALRKIANGEWATGSSGQEIARQALAPACESCGQLFTSPPDVDGCSRPSRHARVEAALADSPKRDLRELAQKIIDLDCIMEVRGPGVVEQIAELLREAALADSPAPVRDYTRIRTLTAAEQAECPDPCDCACHKIEPESAAPAPSSEAEALKEVIKMLTRNERHLRKALEEIVAVASGEKQVADDDTEGMAWIDKLGRRTLAEMPPAEPLSAMGFCEHKRPAGMCPDCGTVERGAAMPPAGQGAREVVIDSPATRRNDETT